MVSILYALSASIWLHRVVALSALRSRPSGLSRAVTFSAFVSGLAERLRSGVGLGFACGGVSFFQPADLVPESLLYCKMRRHDANSDETGQWPGVSFPHHPNESACSRESGERDPISLADRLERHTVSWGEHDHEGGLGLAWRPTGHGAIAVTSTPKPDTVGSIGLP